MGGENGAAGYSFAHFGVITPHAEHLNSAGKGGGRGFTPPDSVHRHLCSCAEIKTSL